MKKPFILLSLTTLFSFSALGNTYLQKPRAVKQDQKDASYIEERKLKARENQEENWRAREVLKKERKEKTEQQEFDPQLDEGAGFDESQGSID